MSNRTRTKRAGRKRANRKPDLSISITLLARLGFVGSRIRSAVLELGKEQNASPLLVRFVSSPIFLFRRFVCCTLLLLCWCVGHLVFVSCFALCCIYRLCMGCIDVHWDVNVNVCSDRSLCKTTEENDGEGGWTRPSHKQH